MAETQHTSILDTATIFGSPFDVRTDRSEKEITDQILDGLSCAIQESLRAFGVDKFVSKVNQSSNICQITPCFAVLSSDLLDHVKSQETVLFDLKECNGVNRILAQKDTLELENARLRRENAKLRAELERAKQ